VLGDLENMLGYFTLSYALQNSLLYGSIIFLRKHADYRPAYRVPLGRTLAVVSILLTIGTAAATALAYPAAGLVAALGLILSGLPVYLFMTRRKPA
jgi:fructoselysine transporter